MSKQSQSVKKENYKYYNKLYKKRGSFLYLMFYPLISYDQQSKTKRNIYFLKKYLAKNIIPTNCNYLDYGFGHGSMFYKLPKTWQYFGYEISEYAKNNMIKRAKYLNINYTNYLYKQLINVRDDNKFDLITCSHVLEHLENDDEIIKLFYNKLSNKGLLLINLPINEYFDDIKHLRKYDRDSAMELLEKNGLRIIDVIEEDRLSALLMYIDNNGNRNILIKFISKLIKLFFGLSPYRLHCFFDNLLKSRYYYQQLIILASK